MPITLGSRAMRSGAPRRGWLPRASGILSNGGQHVLVVLAAQRGVVVERARLPSAARNVRHGERALIRLQPLNAFADRRKSQCFRGHGMSWAESARCDESAPLRTPLDRQFWISATACRPDFFSPRASPLSGSRLRLLLILRRADQTLARGLENLIRNLWIIEDARHGHGPDH
jgi:hypothetical protein